jgi:transcriptional regulator with XRE-family HTH domain
MITRHQLRAARGFLGWDRHEVAERSGVSVGTLKNIDAGRTEPHKGTLADLLKVFEDNGIEFAGDNGVFLKQDRVIRLSGENVFFRVLDDVIATLRGVAGAEALFACVSDQLSPQAVIENYRRLRETGIAMRSLVRDGDTCLMGKLKEYRYLPEKFFHNSAMVIYGNKFATMILDPETGTDAEAVIIRNPHVAAAQRNLFNCLWSVCQAPKASKAKVRYDE